MTTRFTITKFLNAQRNLLLVVPLIGLVIMLLPMEIREQLYLHIELTKQGEYWRFITGHFTYASWLHWLLNTIGIILFMVFFSNLFIRWDWAVALAFVLFVISCGLLLLSVNLTWYAGFSGTLTGLYGYAAINSFTENRIFSTGVISLLFMYILMQLLGGELVEGRLITIQTSSYAHAFGLCGGISFGGLKFISSRHIQKNRNQNK